VKWPIILAAQGAVVIAAAASDGAELAAVIAGLFGIVNTCLTFAIPMLIRQVRREAAARRAADWRRSPDGPGPTPAEREAARKDPRP
jgi:hypothetical protein